MERNPVSYLLNIVYLALLIVASPWILYAAIFKGKYREGFGEKFLGHVPERNDDATCIWLHAVSVGEVNLLATLLKEIEQRRPDVQCVISTTTMTGYALAKKKYAPHTVFYCPLDFSWAVNAAMRRIRPDVLILAELELWPNLIRSAKQHGASVAVVNGRLSEKSFRGYRRLGPLVKSVLQQIDGIGVQSEEYGDRFRKLLGVKGSGVFSSEVETSQSSKENFSEEKTPDPVCVTGSLKFDGARTDRNNAKTQELAKLAGVGPGEMVFLAGSTQAPEEGLAIATFKALRQQHANLRLILVPRHPDRFDEVATLLAKSGLAWQRRSELVERERGTDSQSVTDGLQNRPTNSILLVDTIGELGAWWGMADIAYVGGSMGSRGGQNMIEPAAYGAAVGFGPNTWNFRDVVQMMLAAEVAHVVNNGEELTTFVERCLNEPEFAANLGEAASGLVATQLGATKRTINMVEPLLPLRVVDEATSPFVREMTGTRSLVHYG